MQCVGTVGRWSGGEEKEALFLSSCICSEASRKGGLDPQVLDGVLQLLCAVPMGEREPRCAGPPPGGCTGVWHSINCVSPVVHGSPLTQGSCVPQGSGWARRLPRKRWVPRVQRHRAWEELLRHFPWSAAPQLGVTPPDQAGEWSVRAAHGAASRRGGERVLRPPGASGDPPRGASPLRGPAGPDWRAHVLLGPGDERDDPDSALRLSAGADRARAAPPRTGHGKGEGEGGEPVNFEQLPAKSLVLSEPEAGESIGSTTDDDIEVNKFDGFAIDFNWAYDVDGTGGNYDCFAKPEGPYACDYIFLARETRSQPRTRGGMPATSVSAMRLRSWWVMMELLLV